MGRFGNAMFVNGETDYILDVEEGKTVRFYLVNAANTRIFNFSIQDHQLKLISNDIGRYERESLVDSVMMASAERRIIEVLFDNPGAFTILHTTPEKNYSLGTINVKASSNSSNEFSFYNLKENEDVVAGFEPFKKYFLEPPDLEIQLTLKTLMMMKEMELSDKMMEEMEPSDKMMEEMEYTIEWEDVMPVMNRMSTSENTKWILRDKYSGKENYDIGYQVNVGDIKKIRLFNDPNLAHPMQHPIHLHGQRFIVVSENGITNDNLVWKDTVLVPAGSTVDIIVDFTNPGVWVMHCHILEHAESMITAVTVNS
jgi:FtsP/CotA-like multicopper oxidase with cupredoxin domain